jgi:hypothetical protein
MNSVRGTIVCDNAARRTNAKQAVNQYADQHGISDDPITVDIPTGKYGTGPTFLFMGWFDDDRAGADAAWDVLDGLAVNWVQQGSEILQADGATVVHHVRWVANGNAGRQVLV